MEFYKEFLIKTVSIIVRKKEKPYYKRVFHQRLAGSGFVCILSGSGTYTDKYGMRFSFRENDFLLVEYGEPYTIEADNCELEYITTAFTLDERDSFGAFGLPTFFCAKGDSLRVKVLSLLRTWENNHAYSRIESRLLLNEIFLDIRKEIGNIHTDESVSPVNPAVIYINKNYNKDISLKDLAAICLMSESYFRCQFKKYTGTSPLRYREELRISDAKKLLKTNLFSAGEIAEKLGYCDIYHFSKAFKKHVGLSPDAYKKKKIQR